jgi:hypothetical protein
MIGSFLGRFWLSQWFIGESDPVTREYVKICPRLQFNVPEIINMTIKSQ